MYGESGKTYTLPLDVAEAIRAIVDYNWHDEERDFKECAENDNSTDGHVFTHLTRVNEWLEKSCNL